MNRKVLFGVVIVVVALVALRGLLGQQSQPIDEEEDQQPPQETPPEILFTSNQGTGARREEIYTMMADGSEVTRITFTDYHHFIVGSTDSGRFIVATRATDDTSSPAGIGDEDRKSLWVLDLETGDEVRLTGELDNAEGDSFSPDGEWVVFWMIPAGEMTSDIYKIKRDGSELTKLTDTPDVNEFDPQWSNTGDKIAYNSYSTSTPRFVLNVINSDGSEAITIYDGMDTVSTPYFPPGVFDPSWSPDDEWIVFEKPVHYDGENGDAGVWHILKIRSDGTGLVDLSAAGGHDEWAEYLPSFSGDGEYIVFTARYGSKDPAGTDVYIFMMDKDGGSLLQLTDDSTFNDGAVWIR